MLSVRSIGKSSIKEGEKWGIRASGSGNTSSLFVKFYHFLNKRQSRDNGTLNRGAAGASFSRGVAFKSMQK